MKKQTIAIALIIIMALAATAHYYSLDKLVMIQSAIYQQDANWTAGITSVSHLPAEDKKYMCGARIAPLPDDAVIVSRPKTLSSAAIADPSLFDWRNKDGVNWMTPVKGQGYCGSCWAFSAIGVIEACFNIYMDDPELDLDLSEQYVVSDCCSRVECGTCSGGWADWTMTWISQHGIVDEQCYPYRAADTPCAPCADGDLYFITDNVYIPSNKDDYKWALQKYGPLAVVLTNPEDWFFYTGGVYEPTWTSDGFGWADHAVILVGWDDSKNAWICKNSYGEGWGLEGYGYVNYDTLLYYDYAFAVTGIVPIDAPPHINNETDTISLDKPSYTPGDIVTMAATGTNVGSAAWTGTVKFKIISPEGEYTTATVPTVSVGVGKTETFGTTFMLPYNAVEGTWIIISQWIDDNEIIHAMSIIPI